MGSLENYLLGITLRGSNPLHPPLPIRPLIFPDKCDFTPIRHILTCATAVNKSKPFSLRFKMNKNTQNIDFLSFTIEVVMVATVSTKLPMRNTYTIFC